MMEMIECYEEVDEVPARVDGVGQHGGVATQAGYLASTPVTMKSTLFCSDTIGLLPI